MTSRIAAPDIDLGGSTAGSTFARATLFLFCVAVPLDVIPLFADEGSGAARSVAYFAGMLLAGGAAWQVASTGRLRSITAPVLLLTAYTAWALASVLWSWDTEEALHRFTVNVMLLAALWMGWQVAQTRRDVRLMASGYVIGCVVAAGATWQSFLTGTGYNDYTERFSGMGYDPNDMGVALSIAMPLAAYLAMTSSHKRAYLWLAYLPIGLSAIALSGSRGATITVAVAVLGVSVWVARRSQFLTITLAGLLVAVVLTVAARTPETFQRVLTMRESIATGKLSDRGKIWRSAGQIFIQHPVLGVGTGQFPATVRPYMGYRIEAHNAFIAVATELGVVGLALFLGAFASVILAAWKMRPSHERRLVLIMVATWFVGVTSLTWELRKATWFVALVGAVVAKLAPHDDDVTP